MTSEVPLLRDRIITGLVNAAVTKQLLSIRDLTLSRCIDVCRSHFLAERQLSTMKNADLVLHKLQVTEPEKLQAVNCMFYGTRHTRNKECCPAWGEICTKFKKRNHFAVLQKSYCSFSWRAVGIFLRKFGD